MSELKQCKDCNFFHSFVDEFTQEDCMDFHLGNCKHPKMQGDNSNETDVLEKGILVRYGGCDGYGDYLHVHKNFGCILWEKK